jgi:hypothetical protein
MNAQTVTPLHSQGVEAASADLPVVATSSAALVLDERSLANMERVARLMASGKATVPQHLRNNEGDCFAIVMQSIQWRMNPFAVSQKTHLVNGILGYEGQLVNAVITTMAPTKDRLHYEWYGDWKKVIGKFEIKRGDKGEYRVPNWMLEDEEGLGIKVWATLKGEDEPRYLDLLLAQARTRNSPLWADDPRQQLSYLAVKRWARLYTPDVILGVYTNDELEEVDRPTERDLNPRPAEKQIEYVTNAEFGSNKQKWKDSVEAGRKSTDSLITWIESKGKKLTEAQLTEIGTWKKKPETIDGEAQQVDDPFVQAMNTAESQSQQQGDQA